VVGLYGVIAYSVSQRTREIGVRMVMGAQRSSVYKLVMQQAGWLTGIGLAGRVGLLAGSIAANPESIVRIAGVGRGDSELRGRVAGAGVDGGELPARASRGVGEPNRCVASGVTVRQLPSD